LVVLGFELRASCLLCIHFHSSILWWITVPNFDKVQLLYFVFCYLFDMSSFFIQ
jgi:hypothetical protein